MIKLLGDNPEEILLESCKVLGCEYENVRDITVEDVEGILTESNIKKTEGYIALVNPKEPEISYIRDLVDTFRQHQGLPITNAFLLHELLESQLIEQSGIDISNTFIPMGLHFQSVSFHTYYLYLKALSQGITVSYPEVLSYDPVSCPLDKRALRGEYQLEEFQLDNTHDLFQFFKELLSKEYGYGVFGESPLGNGDFYKDY